jgi:hypothetical protein
MWRFASNVATMQRLRNCNIAALANFPMLWQPLRSFATTCGNGDTGSARTDSWPFPLEVCAVGKGHIAFSIAPGKGTTSSGMAKSRHVLAHWRCLGFIMHESVSHANSSLSHEAVVLPCPLNDGISRVLNSGMF